MRLTIRMTATKDEVEIDGHTFDRSKLKRTQRREFDRQVVAALFPRNRKGARRNAR